MHKVLNKILILLICLLCWAGSSWATGDDAIWKIEPNTNNGTKWRIGYYQGGAYSDYTRVLAATIRSLMNMGWIEQAQLPNMNEQQAKAFWLWLGKNLKSKYIEFVPDAFYNANWHMDTRSEIVSQLEQRLNREKDIDLLIAAGTWAGKDMATDRHHTPTLIISTSDPLGSGIIKSVADSGFDHIHARVAPERDRRQLEVFYDIIGFKKLGLAFENSDLGRAYAAWDVVREFGDEVGFEVDVCHTLHENVDKKEAEQSVIDCFKKLAPKVDAIYVTIQSGVNSESIPALAKIAAEYDIPTFSQSGSDEVKEGFLLSISQANFKYLGEFEAKAIATILNGVQPRKVKQLFEDPPKIAFNLSTAKDIYFDPPVDVLIAADEVFQ